MNNTTPPEKKRSGHGSRWRWHGWVERLSLSSGHEVMALLSAQGEVSLRALEAFESWSKDPTGESATSVRELEHAADDARFRLWAALKVSLATPVGQEDLFVLSERCDRVVNRVKNIVAEAEVLSWSPDSYAAEMAADLRQGMRSVLEGFQALGGHGDQTADAALQATRCVRRVEHTYRNAMAELSRRPDMREVFTAREIYRFYGRVAESLEALADRLWYAVLSEP